MSSARIQSRVPSARFVTVASLHQHELRFHNIGEDGSAKCDAYETGNEQHSVMGVVFDICETEKPILDEKESLGYGYEIKTVELFTSSNEKIDAYLYYAIQIDPTLKPFHWYKQHVLRGAKEYDLPVHYVAQIDEVESIDDPSDERVIREMRIYQPD